MHGLDGSIYEEDVPGCKIPAPTINWGEILPYRAQNYWTGSIDCPIQPQVASYNRKTGQFKVQGNEIVNQINI